MKKILSTLLVTILVAVGAQAPLYADIYEGYALADGTVTNVRGFTPTSTTTCYIAYEITLDDKTYTGENISQDFCHLEVGDTIKIKYLEADSRKHEIASEWEIGQMTPAEPQEGLSGIGGWSGPGPNPIFFLIPFGAIFITVIAAFIFNFKNIKKRLSDHDGDGLMNDDKPATAEQRKLVQEGFRKLGVYHDPKKKMTQAQARETLREIEKQLKKN